MKKFLIACVVGLALAAVPLSAQVVVSGVISLDGSNPTVATTGLAPNGALTACVVSADESHTLGVDLSTFTVQYTPSNGVLYIYAWKPTSSSVTTLVASTSTARVVYVCTGRTN